MSKIKSQSEFGYIVKIWKLEFRIQGQIFNSAFPVGFLYLQTDTVLTYVCVCVFNECLFMPH